MAAEGAIDQSERDQSKPATRSLAMTPKSGKSRASADQRPVPANVQTEPVEQDHNHPVTVEEFDREHMGIAAKE